VLTTAVEHPAILKCCAFLEKQGCTVTVLPVDSEGALDLDLVEKSIRPDTAIVSVMRANNETGVLFPVADIAALCRSRGVLCHTDAVQAPGKLDLDVKALGVDFLSLSAHKLRGPKGIGLLYVKRRTQYQPYLLGGGQERGRRAGTENVPGIVAFGRAAELAATNAESENTRVRALRDRLESGLLCGLSGVARNGPPEPRLPNTANLAFAGVEAEGLLLLLDQAGVCASSGSA
jgi:cysteine desulfurase